LKLSQERGEILEYMAQAGEPQAPKDVAKGIGKNRSAVKKLMFSMLSDGQLVDVPGERGLYALPSEAADEPGGPVDERLAVAEQLPDTDSESAADSEPVHTTVGKPLIPIPERPKRSASGLVATYPDGSVEPWEAKQKRKGYV
jgi:hypothetical protein